MLARARDGRQVSQSRAVLVEPREILDRTDSALDLTVVSDNLAMRPLDRTFSKPRKD